MGVHSNESANKLTKFSKGGDFAEIDYEKPDTLSIACKDVDKVFLLISGPQAVEHASRFVNGAMKAGVRYIVKISHLRDDAEPGVSITRLHRQVEKVMKSQGLSLHSCDQIPLCRTLLISMLNLLEVRMRFTYLEEMQRSVSLTCVTLHQ